MEATYPICEALTVSLISVSASIQGVTIMELDHYLAKPIPDNTTIANTVCFTKQLFIEIKVNIVVTGMY